MAELLLQIGNSPTYADGDVIAATPWRAIRCEHACRLCSCHNPANRHPDSRLKLDSLSDVFFRTTHQYRCERISKTELRRVNQWTGQSVVLSSTPIEDPENPGRLICCHVEEFFERRFRHKDSNGNPRHIVFGSPGREVYYTGTQDYSHPKLDIIWAAITARMGKLDTDFPHNPLSQLQLKSFLVLPMADFNDGTASQYMVPLRTTESVSIVSVTPVGSVSAEQQYRLMPDRSLAKIRQMETLTTEGRELAASMEDNGTYLVSSTVVPRVGTAVVSGVVAKRSRYWDWRELVTAIRVPNVTITTVLDKQKAIDIRGKIVPLDATTTKTRIA